MGSTNGRLEVSALSYLLLAVTVMKFCEINVAVIAFDCIEMRVTLAFCTWDGLLFNSQFIVQSSRKVVNFDRHWQDTLKMHISATYRGSG